jgi:fluoride exporter
LRIILLLVFGAAGTLARFALQGVVQYRTSSLFPVGTLTVNLVGCLLIGLIGRYSLAHLSIPPEWRLAITVGFLGAFTTLSTLGWETMRMLEDGEWLYAGLYVAVSVVGGVLAVALGMRLGEML